MKTLLFITVIAFLSSCVNIEEDIKKESGIIKNDTVTMLFEQGDTWAEKQLIKVTANKNSRLGIDFSGVSHVKIIIDGYVYETHPAHGVMCNKFDGDSSVTRFFIEILVESKQDIKELADYYDSIETDYNYLSILGMSLNPDEQNSFNCASFVACVLGISNYGNCDLSDLIQYSLLSEI